MVVIFVAKLFERYEIGLLRKRVIFNDLTTTRISILIIVILLYNFILIERSETDDVENLHNYTIGIHFYTVTRPLNVGI